MKNEPQFFAWLFSRNLVVLADQGSVSLFVLGYRVHVSPVCSERIRLSFSEASRRSTTMTPCFRGVLYKDLQPRSPGKRNLTEELASKTSQANHALSKPARGCWLADWHSSGRRATSTRVAEERSYSSSRARNPVRYFVANSHASHRLTRYPKSDQAASTAEKRLSRARRATSMYTTSAFAGDKQAPCGKLSRKTDARTDPVDWWRDRSHGVCSKSDIHIFLSSKWPRLVSALSVIFFFESKTVT